MAQFPCNQKHKLIIIEEPMVRLEHIAIYVADLEAMREFYCTTFHLTAGERYENQAKGFSSYFLSSPKGGARIELMHTNQLDESDGDRTFRPGYHHLAFSLGSKVEVDRITADLETRGIPVLDGPRTTGDGYYESVIADPEGNRIELTV